MKKPQESHHLDEDVRRLVDLRHSDPHHVLGIHLDGDGVLIRAFRPEALSISVIPEFGGSIPMQHRTGGLFEARLNGRNQVFKYRLEVRYPGDKTFVLADPYVYPPTLGDLDLHLAGEGQHRRLWEKLGAHIQLNQGVSGVSFAVWAPSALGVSVVGDFNSWDGRLHPMRSLGSTGIWELFVPELGEGARYLYEIRSPKGTSPLLKSDPFAFRTELPPSTVSVVHDLSHHQWSDEKWMAKRRETNLQQRPFSIYEVHLGSWRRVVEDGNRSFNYRELAPLLADYVSQLGFTHIELLPISEYPYGGSWGYQVGNYYAPTSRYGHPDDFRYFVDFLHQRGLGVIVDWVPAHFPKDHRGLARFNGGPVYEHADPREGEHPDWGTLVFNYGRNEVRNFLVANALFWLDQYHIDGLRVDAVASMLYRDYSRKAGEWIPNRWGGRENEEAIGFLRELNQTVRESHPGAAMIAEESTAWPKVSSPVNEGGLGFHFKWNMGWMHDTLLYFQKDPIYRQHHHHQLTFGLLYAYSEHFILPLSHDEVVHGKGSLLSKMPGDLWQRCANLRALLAWMWAHPGKKLLFMGIEFGQHDEWHHDRSLDWHLLQYPEHQGLHRLVEQVNAIYRGEPALYELDGEPGGFQWLQADSAAANVFAFVRRPKSAGNRSIVCVANLSPVPRHGYRIGLPHEGSFIELLNTDARELGGSGLGNLGQVRAEEKAWDDQPFSAMLTLPPLSVLWLGSGADG